MKKLRLTWTTLLIVSLFLLNGAGPALAAQSQITAGFEDGAIPAEWTTAIGTNPENAILQVVQAPKPVHSESYSLEQTINPNNTWCGYSAVSLTPPTGGTKHEATTWIYIEEQYNPGMTSSVMYYQMPNAEIGINIGEGYYGIYTGTEQIYRWDKPTLTKGAWHKLRLAYDQDRQTISFSVDGMDWERDLPVNTAGAAPSNFSIGAVGGWSPGNMLTQYIDDLSLRSWN